MIKTDGKRDTSTHLHNSIVAFLPFPENVYVFQVFFHYEWIFTDRKKRERREERTENTQEKRLGYTYMYKYTCISTGASEHRKVQIYKLRKCPPIHPRQYPVFVNIR